MRHMHEPKWLIATNRGQEPGLSVCQRSRRTAPTEAEVTSKVWFITGAGSGIGAGTAKAALKAGDRVVATGRNLDKVRQALGDENLAFVRLDVADEAQAKVAVEEA